jgi:drug/metabolite transporter (DMT)-like permease
MAAAGPAAAGEGAAADAAKAAGGADPAKAAGLWADGSAGSDGQLLLGAPPAPSGAPGGGPLRLTGPALGLALTLTSTLAFSSSALFVTLLAPRGVPAMQSSSCRFLVQAALSLALIAISAGAAGDWGRLRLVPTWAGKPENRWLLLSRAAWGAVGMSSYFWALSYPGARFADVTVLVFLNVPLTGVLARLLLKEPYGLLDGATALLAVVGVVIVAQPPALFGSGSGATQPVPPVVIAVSLVCAVASALAYLSIRRIGGRGESPAVMVLYFSIIGCVVGPVASAALGEVWVPLGELSPGAAAMLLGVGACGFAGQLLLNKGVQLAPAGPAIVMRYADIIFALLFQATLLSTPPNALKLVGGALIMSVIVSSYAQARRKARAVRAAAAAAAAAVGAAAAPAAGAGAPLPAGAAAAAATPVHCSATVVVPPADAAAWAGLPPACGVAAATPAGALPLGDEELRRAWAAAGGQPRRAQPGAGSGAGSGDGVALTLTLEQRLHARAVAAGAASRARGGSWARVPGDEPPLPASATVSP